MMHKHMFLGIKQSSKTYRCNGLSERLKRTWRLTRRIFILLFLADSSEMHRLVFITHPGRIKYLVSRELKSPMHRQLISVRAESVVVGTVHRGQEEPVGKANVLSYG